MVDTKPEGSRSKTISIIGSGFTGRAVGYGLEKLDHKVIFYDICLKDMPNFNSNLDQVINDSEISFICVPTPSLHDGNIELSPIKNSLTAIGNILKNKDPYHLIVIKSTVVPLTTEDILIPILEKTSGKKAGAGFGVANNPEFMTEATRTWSNDPSFVRDFFNGDRIIIGEYDKRSGDIVKEIYKSLGAPIWRVGLKTAEMIKYTANCMLATKISFWNEIYLICNEIGIDSNIVAPAVACDPRIGKYGTVHGKAFGGKCLPKDLKAFIKMSRQFYDPIVLEAVDRTNEVMKNLYGRRD